MTSPKKPSKNHVPQKGVSKKLDQLVCDNIEISKSLKIFDISMTQYEKILQSIGPAKTLISNSTKVYEK